MASTLDTSSGQVLKKNVATKISHRTPKFEYFEKLPLELQIQILEYCVVEGPGIRICGKFKFDKDMDCQEDDEGEWETLKRIRHHISSISQIERVLVHDPNSLDDKDYHHFAELHSALFHFANEAPLNTRPALRAELSEKVCKFVHQWAWYEKFWVEKRAASNARQNFHNLVQVSSSVAALAGAIFYGQNLFVCQDGFEVLEAWLDTIGPINTSYLKYLWIDLTLLPPSSGNDSIFYKPNLLGLAVDEMAEKIGFRLPHKCSRYPERDHDDRLKESLITFRDVFGRNKSNRFTSRLKHLVLCVDEDVAQVWLQDVQDDGLEDGQHISDLLNFSDKSVFPFHVVFHVAEPEPRCLVRMTDLAEEVAVFHTEFLKLGWRLHFENALLDAFIGEGRELEPKLQGCVAHAVFDFLQPT